jgi:hypothetical protein
MRALSLVDLKAATRCGGVRSVVRFRRSRDAETTL